MAKLRLSQEDVKDVLSYDPETGIFVWLVQCGRQAKGKLAGTKRKAGNSVYIGIQVKGRMCWAHRLAWLYMTGDWPQFDIDHKNGDGCDNRIENLRACTRSQNHMNRRAYVGTKTGLKGAHPTKNGKFFAHIQINGKVKHLGTYETAQEAHEAYMRAAKALFGEFARSA